jgi:hypothetical protein
LAIAGRWIANFVLSISGWSRCLIVALFSAIWRREITEISALIKRSRIPVEKSGAKTSESSK